MKNLPIRIFFLTLISFFIIRHAKAETHGGEISYKYLSGTNYEVDGVFYTDCKSSPNLSWLQVTDGKTTKGYSYNAKLDRDITPIESGQCDAYNSSSCGFNFGTRKYLMTVIVDVSAYKNCMLTLSWVYYSIAYS